jgi:hypothetical protein
MQHLEQARRRNAAAAPAVHHGVAAERRVQRLGVRGPVARDEVDDLRAEPRMLALHLPRTLAGARMQQPP